MARSARTPRGVRYLLMRQAEAYALAQLQVYESSAPRSNQGSDAFRVHLTKMEAVTAASMRCPQRTYRVPVLRDVLLRLRTTLVMGTFFTRTTRLPVAGSALALWISSSEGGLWNNPAM